MNFFKRNAVTLASNLVIIVIEQIIIAIIFILALGYLFQVVRKNFRIKPASGCAKGCGTCSTPDLKTVEAGKPVRKVGQA